MLQHYDSSVNESCFSYRRFWETLHVGSREPWSLYFKWEFLLGGLLFAITWSFAYITYTHHTCIAVLHIFAHIFWSPCGLLYSFKGIYTVPVEASTQVRLRVVPQCCTLQAHKMQTHTKGRSQLSVSWWPPAGQEQALYCACRCMSVCVHWVKPGYCSTQGKNKAN